jgi:hypothetical protein
VCQKLAKQRMSPVRREDGERMARELGAVKYVECSALTQYKLKDVFDEVRPPAFRPVHLLMLPRRSLQPSSLHKNRRRRRSVSCCNHGLEVAVSPELYAPS